MQGLVKKTAIVFCAAGIAAAIVFLYDYDKAELTHVRAELQIIDKWHRDICQPFFGADNLYLGESCSDEWTLVVLENGAKHELDVDGAKFRHILVGHRYLRSYDRGRLGGKYNEAWEKL